ncbi:MAG: hypothetical protein K0R45_1878 [Pseudomonas sp.]|jgi:hypothetical protein|nr:hypothetical protein [Pseudomonas sp.]
MQSLQVPTKALRIPLTGDKTRPIKNPASAGFLVRKALDENGASKSYARFLKKSLVENIYRKQAIEAGIFAGVRNGTQVIHKFRREPFHLWSQA